MILFAGAYREGRKSPLRSIVGCIGLIDSLKQVHLKATLSLLLTPCHNQSSDPQRLCDSVDWYSHFEMNQNRLTTNHLTSLTCQLELVCSSHGGGSQEIFTWLKKHHQYHRGLRWQWKSLLNVLTFGYSGKISRGTTDTLFICTLRAVIFVTLRVIQLEKVVQNLSLILVEIINDTSSLESTLVSLSHWSALLWMTELPKTSSLQARVEYMQLLMHSAMPGLIPQAKWKRQYGNFRRKPSCFLR